MMKREELFPVIKNGFVKKLFIKEKLIFCINDLQVKIFF